MVEQRGRDEPPTHQELINSARDLVASASAWWGPSRQMNWDDIFSKPLAHAARSVFWRQVDGLAAVALLADSELGHPALAQVRLAFDEYLWIQYLASIDRSHADALLPLLGMREAHLLVQAQQQFAGKAGMRSLGFSKSFVQQTDRDRREVEARLGRLAKELTWPEDDAHRVTLPNMDWLAQRANEHRLYTFLYAATSKGVHFSMSEFYRRTWGDPGGSITVSGGSSYNRYRTEFALYWCCYLFVKTMVAVFAAGDFRNDPDSGAVANTWAATVETFASFGRVPIITDEEMKLAHPAGRRPGSRGRGEPGCGA